MNRDKAREWYVTHRQPANEESRNHATHYGEEWLASEEELVSLCCNEQDLIDAAEILGRTIEAVRIRLHYIRSRGTVRTTTRTRTITFTETVTSNETCTRCGLNHPGEC